MDIEEETAAAAATVHDDDAKEEGGRPPWVDHLPNAKTRVINAKRCSDGAESRTCQSSQPQ